MIYAFAETAATGAGTATQATAAGSGMMSLLSMVFLIAVFYFILIRPQRKKDKESKLMLANLKVGDNIITIGGIVGTVVKIKDEKIVVETGTKTEKQVLMMERWAVRDIVKPVTAD